MERRLAAILAADVVGYSRLMGEDEAGTLATLKAHREELIDRKVAEHNGRIVKLMGDGTLMEFGSAVDAVAFAVEIQRAMIERNTDFPENRRITYRVGINLGDIIVDGDDIYGDGVNVAARLEKLAEPGGVCIAGSVFDQVEGKLSLTVDDLGRQQVKNITKPVRVYRVRLEPTKTAHAGSALTGPLMTRPAVAVLPFNNISGDQEQEYFSDGLTEDLITALAAWRTFPVIARNSTFAYKGQPVDVRAVAKDIGARYLLEGSVRKAANRVRITAQLIDGSTGNHLWAEHYDREIEDIFAVQDEITTRIVAAVEPQMSTAEITTVMMKRPENLTSWELYLRGLANMSSYGRLRTETKRLFEQSIKADPAFADAYTALALCYSADIYAQHAGNVDEALATMFDLAKKASEIDPRNFRVYQVLCITHFWEGDLKKSVEAGRKAVEINPSASEVYENLAAALTHFGKPEEAENCAKMCLKLSPLDPKVHNYYFQLMQASLGQRQFEKSYEYLDYCLSARPHDVTLLGFRTVLLGHMGRREEARECLQRYLAKRDIKNADDYRRIFVPNSILAELNLEGLRKAGWNV